MVTFVGTYVYVVVSFLCAVCGCASNSYTQHSTAQYKRNLASENFNLLDEVVQKQLCENAQNWNTQCNRILQYKVMKTESQIALNVNHRIGGTDYKVRVGIAGLGDIVFVCKY
jgi:hypothetical protein